MSPAGGRHGSMSDGYGDGDTDVVIGDPPLLLNIGPIPERSHVTHLVKCLVTNI